MPLSGRKRYHIVLPKIEIYLLAPTQIKKYVNFSTLSKTYIQKVNAKSNPYNINALFNF